MRLQLYRVFRSPERVESIIHAESGDLEVSTRGKEGRMTRMILYEGESVYFPTE